MLEINSPEKIAGSQIIDMKEHGTLGFIHNPRTGGSSLNGWLYDNKKPEWDSYKFRQHHARDKMMSLHINGEPFKIDKTVCIVRHPYMRYLSFWRYINRDKARKDQISFRKFWEGPGNINQIQAFRRPQTIYWKGCDIILRHEDLVNEVAVKLQPIFQTTNRLDAYRYNYQGVDTSLVNAHESIPKEFLAEIREIDSETFNEFGYGEYD